MVKKLHHTKKQEVSWPDPNDLLKLLFYSPAGHGKTVLIGTAIGDPEFSPVLLLDFEGGIRSIRSRTKVIALEDLGKEEPLIDKAHVIHLKEWDDFDAVHEFLSDTQRDHHIYRTVALDSLSEMNYLHLSNVLSDAVAQDATHDPDVPLRPEYLRHSGRMRKLIRFFRDLPVHTLFSSGAGEAEDPQTRLMKLRPNLTGKLAYELPGLLDTIGYLAIVEDGEDIYRSLYVQPTTKFMAKDRSEGGALGMCVDKPTIPLIWQLLHQEPVE